MSLEAMVAGALRDMTPNDCQYVIGEFDSSGLFDCGFVPRFCFFMDNSASYSFVIFPKEGVNSSYYFYSGDRCKSYTFTLSETVLDFSSINGFFNYVIAFK